MQKTILLADDSVTIQKVVELTFMEEEVDVVTVGTGSEALPHLQELSPDLVIADVHMPGPDGYEICRRVKAERPEVPVLLLVGTFEPFNPSDVEACGADAFLKKPFDSQELIRIVEGLLERGERPERAPEVALAPAAGEEEAAVESAEPAPYDEEDAPLEGEPEAALEEAPAAVTEDAPEVAVAEPAAAEAEIAGAPLSDADVDRIARRVVELLAPDTVREVAWEVVPDLAEVVIKDRLRELEAQVE